MRDRFVFSGDFHGAVVTINTASADRPSTDDAWRRFEKLRRSEPMRPGPLPAGSVMPWATNPLFVARDSEIDAIRRLMADSHDHRAVALGGLGGVGKTQTAVEFVHRYGQLFAGGVFWIACGDPQAIGGQAAALGALSALNLSDGFDRLPQPEQIALVRNAWAEPYPRLVVFDNCEDEETFASWRPVTGGCRVLITARRSDWSSALGVIAVALGVLERPDSIRLLASFHPDLGQHSETLSEIAEELGDLPLALHMAGAFLGRYRHSAAGEPVKYLARLKAAVLDHPSMIKGDWSPTGHELHVGRTFGLSYGALDPSVEADAGALSILAILCAYAPGEVIPRSYITVLGDSGETPESLEIGKADAIGRLLDLGLVEERPEGLFVHRLVSAFVQPLIDPSVVEGLARDILESAEWANSLEDSRLISDWEVHLLHVTEQALNRDSPIGMELLQQVGLYRYNRGDLDEARRVNERRRSLLRDLGAADGALAASLNDLAVSVRMVDPDRAAELLQRSIELQLQDPEANARTLVATYQNLGEALRGSPGALEAFEEARRRFLSVWGRRLDIPSEPPEPRFDATLSAAIDDPAGLWIRIICGIASVNSSKHPGVAEKAFREDLKPEDPDSLEFSHWRVLQQLGSFREKVGDLGQAQLYTERAVEVAEAKFGPDAPVLGDLLFQLGNLQSKKGEKFQARASLERATTLAKTVLGWDHPATLGFSDALMMVLTELGDFPAVLALFSERLAAAEAHSSTVRDDMPHVLFAIGFSHFQMRNIAEAERFWERALRIAKRRPQRHKDTIRLANSFLAKLRKPRRR